MENCNVCGGVVASGTGSFISGIVTGVGVFGCVDCQASADRVELVRQIRAIQVKYHHMDHHNYTHNGQQYQGHNFIFRNGDVISINHSLGFCSLDELVEYVESKDYNNDVVIDTAARRAYYAKSDTPYPDDPFSAQNWW